jgi:hypothetical protein
MAMLIGAQESKYWLNSIFSTLLVLLNVVVQIFLCVIINDTFTAQYFTTDLINDLKMWRASTSHDIMWVDKMTDQSLAGRICDGHTILPVSSSVAELFQTTVDYVGSPDHLEMINPDPAMNEWWILNIAVGPCLAIVACGIWWMIISQDVMHIIDMVEAMGNLKVAKTKIKALGHNRWLASISHRRKYVMYLLLFVRACVCLIMCVTGTMMLCYEVSMGDILMNAAALSIVLELDNLIFVAFAPGQVRALIKSMLPIPRPHDFKFHGLSVRYPAILSAMMIWVVILFYAHLKPQRKQIQQAQDAICGGNLGFVSSVAANGAVVAAKNDLAVKGFDKVEQLYRYRAMQQMIEDMAFVTSGMSTPGSRPYAGDLSGGSVGTRGPSYSLKAISQMQVKDITGYWNTNCGDAPNPDRCVNLSGGCWQIVDSIHWGNCVEAVFCTNAKEVKRIWG